MHNQKRLLVHQQPAARQSSFPQLSDDVQTGLLNVGMRARKAVSEGYKHQTSIPSYIPPHLLGVQQVQPSQTFYSERELSQPVALSKKRGRDAVQTEHDDYGDTEDDEDDSSSAAVTDAQQMRYYVPRKFKSQGSQSGEIPEVTFLK